MLINFVPGFTMDLDVRTSASRAAFTVPQKSVSSRPRTTSALATNCRAFAL